MKTERRNGRLTARIGLAGDRRFKGSHLQTVARPPSMVSVLRPGESPPHGSAERSGVPSWVAQSNSPVNSELSTYNPSPAPL